MGNQFRYIHDEALFPCGGFQCHLCESDTKPIYTYIGVIVHPEFAANPALAREEPEISELCADCVLSGHVRKDIDPCIQKTINRFASDKKAALEGYYRTPDIPLFLQYRDWSMCCGDWCEFTGVPASYCESIAIPSLYQYWEREPRNWHLKEELKPESLREISLFKCLSCTKMYFTWQFT